jgi:peptidoglycan/xylan/chitin deacetylase (PgdA/CDA1 family)
MEGESIPTLSHLSAQLTERFGPLLTHDQLAALLGRTPGGLRYSLGHPADESTRALRDCGRRIGRRVYYPAAEVAAIISRGGVR